VSENDEALQRMDKAAEDARDELDAFIDQWSAISLADWWSRWYLKAGHKRLGRILVEYGKPKK